MQLLAVGGRLVSLLQDMVPVSGFSGVSALVRCRHASAKWVFGKTFCPDCGVGLVFRWIVLRCAHCQQPRQSNVRQGNVLPANNCCTYCGERAVLSEELHDPQYFHLHYATLVLREEVREGDRCSTGFNTLEDFTPRTFHDSRLSEPLLLESD